jgi:hypothetical protein
MNTPCKSKSGLPIIAWVLILVLAAGLWQALGAKADAADIPTSDLVELSAGASLGPDSSADIAGAIGVRLGVLPAWVPLFNGHAAFVGGGYIDQHGALFGDVALQRADADTTRLRIGIWAWAPEDDWKRPSVALVLRWPALGLW